MPDLLHRCSAHGPWPTEHPCTLAVPHLHYPAWPQPDDWWVPMGVAAHPIPAAVYAMLTAWWPQRRPRQGVRLLRTRPRAAA